MVKSTSREERPDEDRDVIVQRVQVLDQAHNPLPKPWHVYVGAKLLASFDTNEGAAEHARSLAKDRGVRAWEWTVVNGYRLIELS
jgi:hypothetical protein